MRETNTLGFSFFALKLLESWSWSLTTRYFYPAAEGDPANPVI
jgi:hypothetical protein